MNRENLLDFYEKFYFHEIDYRDKIAARLQLPLAIYLSFLSLIGFMIRNINFECKSAYLVLFVVFFLISSILMIIGIIYFVGAFYGHTYEFLPTAKKTEDYRLELNETYKEYENGSNLSDNYLEEYIYKYYYECSSINATVNDERSAKLHKSNSFIVFSVIPLLITFLIFHFGSVDKNSVKKIESIEITKPVELLVPKDPLKITLSDGGSIIMTDENKKKDQPPPPPSPPPKRVIREDVQLKINKESTTKERGN